ncbi:protein of unknown function (plasmid) [Cupriavidus taiwanensis]|uniref:Uncharacterized protein n=1 Tax=Cupriavidus taiwanensis TaxID=164546 RepID=A0A375ECR2_9BURK|nr:hypothetical protein CBM2614_U10001 [Cupriavidus taiwanensis]SOZ73286.1 hypothetical protein CBM2615_U10001 [Cupriavidus taiwanensis]SOZ75217.1 hypothetical protein CBM2613_U10119 [Cupriavidus taiwanensis]SOZ75218.1 hypothetical protein CBM2613_U10120 [Cupriavidus taiwanensis]SPA03675.1 protein of unknown function [Cupriavidus taiwanensis]
MYCEECGLKCRQVHETAGRRVRDLPLFEPSGAECAPDAALAETAALLMLRKEAEAIWGRDEED